MEENAGACNLCEGNAMGTNGCARETRCPSFGGQQMCTVDIGIGSTEGSSLDQISLQPSLGRNPPKHHDLHSCCLLPTPPCLCYI